MQFFFSFLSWNGCAITRAISATQALKSKAKIVSDMWV